MGSRPLHVAVEGAVNRAASTSGLAHTTISAVAATIDVIAAVRPIAR